MLGPQCVNPFDEERMKSGKPEEEEEEEEQEGEKLDSKYLSEEETEKGKEEATETDKQKEKDVGQVGYIAKHKFFNIIVSILRTK